MEAMKEQWLWLISTPLYFIIIGAELLLTHIQHRKAYTVKDTFANLYLMLLNSGIDLAFRLIYLAVLSWFYSRSSVTWSYAVVYWFMLVIAEDFIYYWLHRFDHEV